MWLLTPIGFFSIVEKPEDKASDTLTVRARAKIDLVNLQANLLPELGPIRTSGSTDYRYRAQAPRTAVASAMARAIEELDYSNFKNVVAMRQGAERADLYHDVWAVLYKLQGSKKHDIPVPDGKPDTAADNLLAPAASAYGGVVIDKKGHVLLREPKGHFDGYVWTFPKGRPDKGETPSKAALREVREETGYLTEITGLINRVFKGGTSTNVYFLMRPIGKAGPVDSETSSTRWATFAEAKVLISQTKNQVGRTRDLDVLQAAATILGLPHESELL